VEFVMESRLEKNRKFHKPVAGGLMFIGHVALL
jgi:hypothetical protein